MAGFFPARHVLHAPVGLVLGVLLRLLGLGYGIYKLILHTASTHKYTCVVVVICLQEQPGRS